MNNNQFRRLLLANSAKSSSEEQDDRPSSTTKTPHSSVLGSRQRSSIPMTPRSVFGANRSDFAAQLAEKNKAAADGAQKKPRTSTPKGSKLGGAYVDRAGQRIDEDADDRAVRLKAIEESYKKGEIDQATYDRVRSEIAGGDLSSTHLVKGLDTRLLKRVRQGEDVFSGQKSPEEEGDASLQEPTESGDVDDEFEQLEHADVQAVAREKVQKKGQLSTTALHPGQKRSRDQILAELKAAREAAKAKAESTLGSRFKKIGDRKKPGTRIERDSKGREVMIIVDEDGHERRKIRRVDPKLAKEMEKERAAFIPDKNAGVLGMEVPEFYRRQQEEKTEEEDDGDINIFDDAGSDYDPLAGLDDEDGSEDGSASEEDAETGKKPKEESKADSDKEEPGIRRPSSESMPPPPKPVAATEPRNYFKDSKTPLTSANANREAAAADPAVLAALRKAKALNAASKSETEEKEAERQARLKKMLEDSSRDDADMDMGFGTNRQEDEEEDQEETKIKLSTWGDEAEDGGHGGGGKVKRKRGPKKRKGDGNNAADVLQAIARRKAESS